MKNKHFYQIFKLKIKPWIKYWLIKQTEFKGVLSDILEGISFYLTDSLNMKFKMFDIIGRTTQESTSGANVMKFTPRTSTATGANYTCNSKGIVSIVGTANLSQSLAYNQSQDATILNAGTYKLKVIGQNFPTSLKRTDTGSTINLDNNNEATITIANDNTAFRILVPVESGQTYNATYRITLAQGEVATTELYTGGEPAPNPNYEMPIKNTGDNGSVNEKIENKNLFDENTVTFTVGVLDDNGNPTGSTASHYTNNFYQVTPNTNYTLKGTLNSGSSSGRIYYYDKDKKWISRSESFGSNQKTFTTPEKCYYIKIQVVVSITLKTGDVQLEQSSTPTSYVPHSEQNISFPLAQGQKLMQGDYPDDDEKVHHKMGEIILDGTVGGYNADYNWFYLSFTNLQIQKPKTLNVLSNYFKYYNRNEFANDTSLNGISFNTADISTASTFVIRNTNCTNANEYKTWLAEVLPIVQYELAEEQTEDFTEAQQTAWEQIKKARTYKNITHISSEDETPAELKIQYWKEV